MSDLPIHPRTGLQAIGFLRNGQPIWPVIGAAPDDDDSGKKDPPKDSDDSADSDEDDTDEPDPQGADQLGDAGKKALDRMKEQLREEKRRRKEAERKLAEAAKPKPDDRPDPEEIRRQAREEARAEALRERVVDRIEAKAARRFVDPEDAVAILLRGRDLDEFIEDGKIDTEAITNALDELAKAKPHLLAGQTSTGKFDTARGKRSEPDQLTRDDLEGMSPQEIVKAKAEGRLNKLLGQS